jgi:hypothetical protein
MYVQRNVVTLPRNHCCNGEAIMPSVCVVGLHVAVNNRKILSVAQIWFCGEFMSPATMKRTQFFMYGVRHFCPIVTKSGLCQRIFVKVPNIRFHGNPSCVSRAVACGETDRQTARQTDWLTEWHDETNKELFATMRTFLKQLNQQFLYIVLPFLTLIAPSNNNNNNNNNNNMLIENKKRQHA